MKLVPQNPTLLEVHMLNWTHIGYTRISWHINTKGKLNSYW